MKSLIPYKPFSPEQRKEAERIMREGHLALSKLCPKNTSIADFRSDLLKKAPSVSHIQIDATPQHNAILSVRKYEWDILCSISNMIIDLVNKWVAKGLPIILSDEDLYSEAVAAAVNSIYYYNKKNVRFITFAHHSINNAISRAINTSGHFAKVGRNTRKLMVRVDELKQKTNGPITADEIAIKLNLTKRQRKTVDALSISVFNESGLSDNKKGADGKLNDYTALAKREKRDCLEKDQLEAIEKVALTPFEKEVLSAYVAAPINGWRTAIAKKHINPKTGKPFSRMTPILALKRIRKKVARIYGKAA